MMGIPPSEIRTMAWWEFQALRVTWNERHDPDADGEPAEAADSDFIARRQERLAAMGMLRTVH